MTAVATMTARCLTNLYDLMDSTYDAPEIAAKSRTSSFEASPAGGGRS